MSKKIIESGRMGFQVPVMNPFIACMHHKDQFPVGDGNMRPTHYISPRQIGSDFNHKAPWRMYHGDTVPGFPVHPHRGFETVTVMLEGFVDHSDGLGAAGRYGDGDVQWMTAGAGLQHAEMFPLLSDTEENPMELFQIWINLPAKDKFVAPYYKMLWNEKIPVIHETDSAGHEAQIRLLSGTYKGTPGLAPNPNSWASAPENHVNIWVVTLASEAEFTIPAVSGTLHRMLYHYEGGSLTVEGVATDADTYLHLVGDEEITVKNGTQPSRLLLLEGEPINEPVVSYGPFVMNTQDEIMAAYDDYRRTQFGGWPWEHDDPVHDKNTGRFAKYADGTMEYPE
ncbi:MAG: pirin family protein [Lachnospiraceae bacterium]